MARKKYRRRSKQRKKARLAQSAASSKGKLGARPGKADKVSQKGRVVALREREARGKVIPLDAKRKGAVKEAAVKRFRFRLPSGAAWGVEKVLGGARRTWRELKIRVRLSRASGSGDGMSPGRTAPGRVDSGKSAKVLVTRGEFQRGGERSLRAFKSTGAWFAGVARKTITALAARWDGFGERFSPVHDVIAELRPLVRGAATVEGLLAIMLAALLFYPPYLRGLFFARELLPTHVFTAVIFAIFAFYKISRKEFVLFQRPLDCAVFVLLGLYVISSFVAWNDRDAVGAVLKMANYVAVYWLLAYSVRSLAAVQNYLKVFFASGTGVALLGLGAAFGTFHYKDAFVGGRIYSSLQYPNTLASYLTAVNLFGLYLWAAAHGILSRVLFAVGNYLLFLTFLGTQSRGGYLVYPAGLLVLLVGLPGGVRLRALVQFFLQAATVLAVAGRVVACTGGQAELAGWLWVLAGAALIALLQAAWHYLERGLCLHFLLKGSQDAPASSGIPGHPGSEALPARRRLRPWVLPVAAVLAFLVFVGGSYTLWQRRAAVAALAGRAVPQTWVERVKTISLQEKSARERLLWSRDAFRIMTANPVRALFGSGGGGWNALYHQHQDYLYFSTEVHNHFLQVGVETGFPGLLTFCAIWIFFFWSIWRVWQPRAGRHPSGTRRVTNETANPGEAGVPSPQAASAARGAGWAIFSSALALGIHSVLDFNLSLGAVALLLWGLFGLGRGLERLFAPKAAACVSGGQTLPWKGKASKRSQETGRLQLSPALQGVLVGTVVVVFFFLSLNLMLGQKYALAADRALKKQDLQAAVANFEQALKHDPWTFSYRVNLAQVYLYQVERNQDVSALRRAQDLLRGAVKVNRGDSQLRLLYARALFNGGRIEEGLQELEQAVLLLPFKQDVYENLAVGYLNAGRFLLEQARQLDESQKQGQDQDLLQRMGELRQLTCAYLEKAAAVPRGIEARMAGVPEESKKYWVRAPLLAASPFIYLQAGEAAALLERWTQADTYLAAAARDPNLKPEALLWRGLALKEQGRSEEGEELVAEALKLKPDLAEEQEKIEALLRF